MLYGNVFDVEYYIVGANTVCCQVHRRSWEGRLRREQLPHFASGWGTVRMLVGSPLFESSV